MDLGEEPLRAGSKTSVTLSLASITYNAMRLRTQPRDGSTSSAGAWTPGRVQLSGSLFVFDTAIRVPGSATGAMLASRDYEFKVRGGGSGGAGCRGRGRVGGGCWGCCCCRKKGHDWCLGDRG